MPECLKINNGGLDQYGAEHFGRLVFATIRKQRGTESVKVYAAHTLSCRWCRRSALCTHHYKTQPSQFRLVTTAKLVCRSGVVVVNNWLARHFLDSFIHSFDNSLIVKSHNKHV